MTLIQERGIYIKQQRDFEHCSYVPSVRSSAFSCGDDEVKWYPIGLIVETSWGRFERLGRWFFLAAWKWQSHHETLGFHVSIENRDFSIDELGCKHQRYGLIMSDHDLFNPIFIRLVWKPTEILGENMYHMYQISRPSIITHPCLGLQSWLEPLHFQQGFPGRYCIYDSGKGFQGSSSMEMEHLTDF